MQNDWTREIERLREENKLLREALQRLYTGPDRYDIPYEDYIKAALEGRE